MKVVLVYISSMFLITACVIITGDNNKVVKQPSVESVIGKDGIIPDAKKKLD